MTQPTFCLLGPLEVRVDGRVVTPASRSQRRLLALLLLARGRPVPAERLADQVWAEHVPTDPAAALRTQVSRLRRLLGSLGGRLVTTPAGYRLDVRPAELDMARFEKALAGLDPLSSEALDRLDAALGLWRGPVLADVADLSDAEPDVARLEELRALAEESRAEVLLALGRSGQSVAHLESLCRAHPHRERARLLLMESLCRSGRYAEALDACQAWRRHLVDDLGLEPSSGLRRLEREIIQAAEQRPQRVGTISGVEAGLA